MAQIVDPDVGQLRRRLDRRPEPPDLLHWLVLGNAVRAQRVARKQPLAALRDRHPPLAHQRRRVGRDRHAVHAALLGVGRRLRPGPELEVELLEPRRADLAQARAGQHAHAHDGRAALVLGRMQGVAQPRDFLNREEPLSLRLHPPAERLGRVVRAHLPRHREVEHLPQDLAHPVRPDRRRLRELQVLAAALGLCLRRTGAAFRDLAQQALDVGGLDLGDEAMLPVRLDQLAKHRCLVGRVARGEVRGVLAQVSVDQVRDPWRGADFLPLGQRVDPVVNVAAQLLRAVARGGDTPLRPAPDRHAALPPLDREVEVEAPAPSTLDHRREAQHLVVKQLVGTGARLRRLHQFLVQSLPVGHFRTT